VNTSPQSRITIIIPSRSYDRNLSFCVKKIRQFYKKIKIIIILDKKESFKKDKNISVLISGNKTIGYKRNLAVKHCKTDYVCFIDSDAYPTTSWLDQVDKTFKKHKSAAAIGGPNLSPPTNNIEKTLVSIFKNLFFVTLNTAVKSRKKIEGTINFLPGCNLVVKTKIYNKLRGMYEELYSGEEIPLIRNLKKNNFKIIFNPKIYVFHKDRNFKHFFRQRFVYGSTGLRLFIKFPCKQSFLLLISSVPFVYLLIFPLVLLNNFFFIEYIFGISLLSLFCLLIAFKINYSHSYFLKSLKLSLIAIFAPGIGFIASLLLRNDVIKQLFTQE
jgi:cellulose synthase/poly-beta-1,6-N-acetylglucosamine synthase-like glycosyltransferase